MLEFLHCVAVRFWTEILEGGALVERRQFHEDETVSRGTVAGVLGVAPEHWTFEVRPPTGIRAAGPLALAASGAECAMRGTEGHGRESR